MEFQTTWCTCNSPRTPSRAKLCTPVRPRPLSTSPHTPTCNPSRPLSQLETPHNSSASCLVRLVLTMHVFLSGTLKGHAGADCVAQEDRLQKLHDKKFQLWSDCTSPLMSVIDKPCKKMMGWLKCPTALYAAMTTLLPQALCCLFVLAQPGVCARVRACVRACVPACMRACVRVCVRVTGEAACAIPCNIKSTFPPTTDYLKLVVSHLAIDAA